MRLLLPAVALLGAASSVSAAPAKAPPAIQHELPDGLPYPSPSELSLIEQAAHGTLPNSPPPAVISNKGITNLQLIAFNELFEVAFFHKLLLNITESVDGYRFTDAGDRDFVIRALRAILAVSMFPQGEHVTSADYQIHSKRSFMQFGRTMLSYTSTRSLSSRAITFSQFRTLTPPSRSPPPSQM